jgi:peptide/nickel transport system substrate-binding protein
VADDAKSITFSLRKGIKFHDGSDFNAEVVKWNLDNMIETGRQIYWVSVDIIDDYTLRVNLTEFNNIVLREFADNNLIISKESYDKNGLDWVRVNPVGTGPFKFVSFARDVGFKTERNPDYWVKDAEGNQLPYMDGVEYIYVVDPTTKKAVIQSGEADGIVVPLGEEMVDYEKLGLTVLDEPVAVNFLFPDSANPDSPWANQKVREAAEYALDREAIATGLGHGYWQAPYQIPARAFPFYDPDFPLARKYDPEKAKQLLTEAGYPDGFETTIIVNPISGSNDACVAIMNYLADVDIIATMEFPEFSMYQQSYILGTWENAVLVQPFGGQPNYNAGLGYFHGSGFVFKSVERTPEFMEKYTASLQSPTLEVDLVRAMCDQMTIDCTYIPVWETGKNWVYQPYIMDGGFSKRSQSYYWKPEQTWLSK